MILELMKMYFTECDLIKDIFIGTAHVRFKEFNIDLKGVYFRKKKDFFVAVPTFGYTKKGYDKVLRTPMMSFNDEKIQKEFTTQLKELLYKGIVDHKILMQKKIDV
jgi:hypothetical protein